MTGIERISNIIKETFRLEILPDNASYETIAEWDSLGHLKLIFAIEEEFEIKFNAEKIPQLNSLNLLQREIDEQKVSSKNT